MSTTLISRNATAEKTVQLVQVTAQKERNSKSVIMLLQEVPFEPKLSWFEKMFWLIDSLVEYRYDDPGREQVKTPDRLFEDGFGDCDDYSTLWLSILAHVEIQGGPKIVDYESDNTWDHIYVIVPVKNQEKYIVLDNVVGKFRRQFNVEVEHKDEKVFRPLKF